METWTNKQWGALIGALVVLVMITIGAGAAALVVLGGVVGYFVGQFLDGELDLEEVRARAQGRGQGRDVRAQEESSYAGSLGGRIPFAEHVTESPVRGFGRDDEGHTGRGYRNATSEAPTRFVTAKVAGAHSRLFGE